jgi:tubulin beta
MGTNFWEWVCDEHGTGSSGEYSGGNDAHLGRIDVFYHEASGGKHVPRAMLFDFEPGVIGAVTLSRRSANYVQPGKPCEPRAEL